MADNTQLVPRQKIESLINSDYWQDTLKRTLGKNAGAFTTSLVELFSEDKQLSQCNPKDVIKQAMLAGAVNLPINKSIGFAYMTVFKNKGVPTPTLMISSRGFLQLAQRSGKYKLINADVVYEGQIVSKNYMTGEFEIQEHRDSDKVEGFFAYIKTTDGFEKTLYMSVEQMCHHAKIYSSSIKYDAKVTEESLAELIQKTSKEGPIVGKQGWLGCPVQMGIKTVIKQLLYKYGPMSIEVARAVSEEGDDAFINPQQERDNLNSQEKPVFNPADFEDADEVEDTNEESNPFAKK